MNTYRFIRPFLNNVVSDIRCMDRAQFEFVGRYVKNDGMRTYIVRTSQIGCIGGAMIGYDSPRENGIIVKTYCMSMGTGIGYVGGSVLVPAVTLLGFSGLFKDRH